MGGGALSEQATAPRLLITGASGFVGAALARHALAEGAAVFGLDRREGGVAGVVPLRAELDDLAATVAAVRAAAPDYVVHLAARTPANSPGIADEEWLRANPLWTRNLLEALRLEAPGARALVVSSSAVYGGAGAADPIEETAPLRPVTLYGVSKAAQELVASRYHGEYGLRVLCARPFNLVGPGEPRGMLTSTLAAQVLAIAAGEAPPVVRMRHRATSRDFTDVRDAARAYWALLGGGEDGDVYNVCSGIATPIGEIVEALLRAAGVAATIEETGGQPGRADVLTQRGSPAKLAAAAGWAPALALDRSVADLLLALRG